MDCNLSLPFFYFFDSLFLCVFFFVVVLCATRYSFLSLFLPCSYRFLLFSSLHSPFLICFIVFFLTLILFFFFFSSHFPFIFWFFLVFFGFFGVFCSFFVFSLCFLCWGRASHCLRAAARPSVSVALNTFDGISAGARDCGCLAIYTQRSTLRRTCYSIFTAFFYLRHSAQSAFSRRHFGECW